MSVQLNEALRERVPSILDPMHSNLILTQIRATVTPTGYWFVWVADHGNRTVIVNSTRWVWAARIKIKAGLPLNWSEIKQSAIRVQSEWRTSFVISIYARETALKTAVEGRRVLITVLGTELVSGCSYKRARWCYLVLKAERKRSVVVWVIVTVAIRCFYSAKSGVIINSCW